MADGTRVGDVGGHLDELELQELVRLFRSWRRPWWWRLRRRIAFFVGLDCGLYRLGYVIDVDRDRFSEVE